VEGDRLAVGQKHDKDDADEEGVEDERGKYFDNRQHADAEVDLLEEKGVVENRTGGAVEAFAEKEPGDNAAEHPEDKGDVTGRLGFEADLKYHPEDGNVDRRVNEGPEDAEIGAEIFAAEILFGQLQDHPATLEEIFGKKQKNTEIIHGEIIRETE